MAGQSGGDVAICHTDFDAISLCSRLVAPLHWIRLRYLQVYALKNSVVIVNYVYLLYYLWYIYAQIIYRPSESPSF